MFYFRRNRMEEEQISNMDLIAMANNFSEYRIDAKYFPLMFDSSFIIEALKYIYILRRIHKLSIEDILEIKRVFQENFNFFSEKYKEPSSNKKYNKKNLLLSAFFFHFTVMFRHWLCVFDDYICAFSHYFWNLFGYMHM